MAKVDITNGETGLDVRQSLNAMFSELYGMSVLPVKQTNKTGSFTQAIAADTWVEQIFVTPQSGTPDIKIGTSLHGSEIIDTTLIGNYIPVLVQLYFTNTATLYFEVSGGAANIRIDLISPYK